MTKLYILPKINNAIALKLTDKDFLIVDSKIGMDKKRNHQCTFEATCIPKEYYEIVFEDGVIDKLIENEKYVPYDIDKNCQNCINYTECIESELLLLEKENVNKILKEYHEFVKEILLKK